MNRIVLALCFLAMALPLAAAVETWTHVTLVDSECAAKIKDNPDAHNRGCAMSCGKTAGFGVLTADGKFLKFDAAGNKQAMAALEATKKEDHLRATVTGERAGESIKVKTLKLD
jgi:hypothetical protein